MNSDEPSTELLNFIELRTLAKIVPPFRNIGTLRNPAALWKIETFNLVAGSGWQCEAQHRAISHGEGIPSGRLVGDDWSLNVFSKKYIDLNVLSKRKSHRDLTLTISDLQMDGTWAIGTWPP